MVTNDRYTLSRTSDELGVSKATVRNWIRLGIINQVIKDEQGLFFSEKEIKQLVQDIQSGKLPYLRSRRNKIANQDKAVPVGYLSTDRYNHLAEEILKISQEICAEQRLVLVLLEVYLRLLKAKGFIGKSGKFNSSLVLAWVTEEVTLGPYAPLAKELYGLLQAPSMSEIMKLNAFSDIEIKHEEGHDFLGLIYMSLSALGARKQTGSYYTPAVIVERLIESSMSYLQKSTPRVIDPCCGSGNFLINLFILLKKNLIDSGFSTYQAEKKIIAKLISGIDNQALAVILAKMNLSLLLEHPEFVTKIRIYCQDTLRYPCQHSYDLIIGNPPWGYKYYSSELKFLAEKYETAGGTIESFSLFLEWAINHCAENGVIGYVLPEALFTARTHAIARKLIIKRGVIKKVSRLGHFFPQVNAPVISLVFQKTKATKDEKVTIKDENEVYNIGFQEAFGCQHGYSIFATSLEREILQCIVDAPNVKYLKDNAEFALGIVTGNNKKHLKKVADSQKEVVIRGTDVYRYRIKPGSNYLYFQPENYQQVAPERFYRAPEKLVYRFVNKYLVFAYDDQQLLTLNSANIVIPQLKGVSIKYLLAVLNSRVIQFFRQVAFPSVKVLRKHLEMLPLCCPSEKEQNRVIRLIDKILSGSIKNKELMINIYNEIDQILMEYYQLPTEYQDYIQKSYQQVKFLYSSLAGDM